MKPSKYIDPRPSFRLVPYAADYPIFPRSILLMLETNSYHLNPRMSSPASSRLEEGNYKLITWKTNETLQELQIQSKYTLHIITTAFQSWIKFCRVCKDRVEYARRGGVPSGDHFSGIGFRRVTHGSLTLLISGWVQATQISLLSMNTLKHPILPSGGREK
ncbi:uncharacterized protein CIMG_02669 [Coccidioides immitis RS]|uniref:Uncharacterized protein n=1 Tax=Coccidioides immitis (strain RS) TaxID=246410 RepID=J3KLV3_COCIM|nr:uncharacterized protein CIMG_02669 [Coccidioides immitis RS]EAS37315.3 hypothetical protein CIMG_02669 [Coccidioides immitis RS]